MATGRHAPLVEVAHALPGRTRLRVAWLPEARRRGERAAAGALGDAIARVPGVRKVTIEAATGSVLCEHDESLSTAALQAAASAAARAHAPEPRAAPRPPRPAGAPRAAIARELNALLQAANGRLLALTEGRMDLGTCASLGLFGAGMVNAASDGRLSLPRWSDLVWWATQTFASFEHPEAADAPSRPDPEPV